MAYHFKHESEGPRADSIPAQPLDYIQEMRPKVGLGLGGPIELPEDIRPRKFILMGQKRPNGFFNAGGGMYLVNEKFKSIIEAHEPDVHGFLDVDLTFEKTGEPYPERYYYFQCKVWLDATIREKSSIEVKGFKQGNRKQSYWTIDDIPELVRYRLMSIGGYDKLYLDRSETQGHAIWWDERLGEYFTSDEVREDLEKSGLGGWRLQAKRSPEV